MKLTKKDLPDVESFINEVLIEKKSEGAQRIQKILEESVRTGEQIEAVDEDVQIAFSNAVTRLITMSETIRDNVDMGDYNIIPVDESNLQTVEVDEDSMSLTEGLVSILEDF